MEFQLSENFEASEFHIMDWGYYKWNNAVLSLEGKNKHETLLLLSKGSWKAKKRSKLTPIKSMFAVFADTWQSYVANFVQKHLSMKCYKREAPLK